MAKSVSAAFTAIWKRKYGRKEVFTVEYKRRYWTGSAYAYESSWTTLDASQIPAPRSIHWRLDTPNMNTVLASNVTLSMDNRNNVWLPSTTSPSIFAADATATVGYEPYLTKFRIRFGYILDDGTTEILSLFTGYLEDFSLKGGTGTVDYYLSGNEILLKKADAQNVSTAFTLEDCSPATGDGSNKVFLTTSIGVWKITDVQVNGVSMTQGSDYTLSQMDAITAAKITFTTAPTSAHTVKCTGRKWKADQTIEALIALLCTEAGIGSGDRTINPVVFPGSVSGSKTIDTQAQWELGTVLTNISAATSSGDIGLRWIKVDNFADGEYTTSPVWTLLKIGGSGSISAATGALVCSISGVNSQISIQTPFDKATGTISFTTGNFSGLSAAGNSGFGDGVVFMFMCAATGGTDGKVTGYGLRFNLFAFGGNNQVQLVRYNNELPTLGTVLASCGAIPVGTTNTWNISRTVAGLMTVYKDGVSVGSATDATFTTCLFMGVAGYTSIASSAIYPTIDDIYYSFDTDGTYTVSTGSVYESQSFDILSTPTAWGVLAATETLNSGTIVYATASSTDGISFDAYVNISGGVIQSALKRYFKIRATITAATGSYTTPLVSKLVANFSVTTVNLAIANFKGKTCYAAITELAKYADYEWGFDGDGLFFFRSKTVSGAFDLEIDQDRAIVKLNDYRPGWDRISNSGQVRYGDDAYYAEYNSTSASATSPTSAERFYAQILSESSSIILANDVRLSAARAQVIYENNYLPRERYSVTCWMTPQADLADIVRISYFDNQKLNNPILGDNLLTWGGEDVGFGQPQNIVARDVDTKLVGLAFNIEEKTTEMELQRIL